MLGQATIDIPESQARAILDLQVPRSLWHIADAVDKSRCMLELKEDWDGEGSPAYTHETWECASRFLLTNALELWEEFHELVAAPDVHNGPEGSIDIYWKTGNGTLLINIPPGPSVNASFYACDQNGQEIRGTLSLNSDNRWLLLWQSRKR